MTLRIFYASLLSDKQSMSYEDFDCNSFEVSAHVLIVHQSNGPKYFPLVGIRCFAEINE